MNPTTVSRYLLFDEVIFFGTKHQEEPLDPAELSVAVLPIVDLSGYWSTSGSKNDLRIYSLSVTDLDKLPLDGEGEGEGEESDTREFASWLAFEASWIRDMPKVLYAVVQKTHNSGLYTAYHIELTGSSSSSGYHMVLRRKWNVNENGMPYEHGSVVGPSRSGRLTSALALKNTACSAFVQHEPKPLLIPDFPEETNLNKVAVTMDPLSGAVIFSTKGCAVVAHYD